MMAAIAAVVAGSTSCKKNEVPSVMEGEPAMLTVNVSSSAFTKAPLSEENEKNVGNVQILVFRKDGELDAYASSATASDIKMSCTTGEKDIYAVVNAPDLSAISNLSEYKDSRSDLAENRLDNFVMTGNVSKALSASETLTIPVSRIVSRIAISKISTNFTSAAYKSKKFNVTGIYAINVAGDINYGRTSNPGKWYNELSHKTEGLDNLLYENIENGQVTEAAPYEKTSCFYVYPNPTVQDSQSETFSARHTRLVVEATLGGLTYYYPITIPDIKSNKTYTVKNLIITRPGSLSPDTPVSSLECTFSITVSDWQEGTSKDYTI